MANQITEVRLLSVPLENDYKHTLYFADSSSQASYFIGKTVFSETDFSYQRKEHYIRYPKHYDDLEGCNYIMYKNSPYSNKWLYAFITEKKYINEERTDIYFETDVIQTYMFDYTVKPSFVEREHTNDDTLGKNTIPENLECGEFVCEQYETIGSLQNLRVVLAATEYDPDIPSIGGGLIYTGGQSQNGIYSGLVYLAFASDQINKLNDKIKYFSEEGKGDAIQSIFLAPSFLTPVLGEEAIHSDLKEMVIGSTTPGTISKEISKNFLVSNTKVRNKKLSCFPYRYLLVSNNAGGSAVYHYEHFSTNPMKFTIEGVLTPGCSIRLTPRNYKGIDYNSEEGLNLGKYPICNWSSDVYTNWLTQNGVNIGLNIAAGVGQVIAGAAMAVGTGGVGVAVGGGQIAGGVSAIASQLAQIHQMSFTPYQSRGNTNCGDVITATGNNTFSFYYMTIKEEYIKILDSYFDMFGYKVNSVKVPNTNHRENYWFTKTIDVSIDGNMSSSDMQKIKNCYNSGITFWKNPANIGNYEVSNKIK